MSATQIYEQNIKPLPLSERIAIAAMILNDISRVPTDVENAWSEEDLRDFATASLTRLPEKREDSHGA